MRNEFRGKKRRSEDPNVIEICTLARRRAGSRHVLNQSDAMTKMFRVTAPMGLSSQKFWSFNRHLRLNGHVHERDLVSIARNGLQGDAGDGAPAQMRVRGADAIDARLRRDCEIGSSCDRARENDRTVAVVDDGPFGSFRLE